MQNKNTVSPKISFEKKTKNYVELDFFKLKQQFLADLLKFSRNT